MVRISSEYIGEKAERHIALLGKCVMAWEKGVIFLPGLDKD